MCEKIQGREAKERKDKQVINCAAEILIEANTPKHRFNHSALEERKGAV